ncbi:MAG: hypothetical protein ISR65_03595 [Bacteriovoracaceae bacterium]|nr:hypothetical protein [Bacteriovoracaceae bacterium]
MEKRPLIIVKPLDDTLAAISEHFTKRPNITLYESATFDEAIQTLLQVCPAVVIFNNAKDCYKFLKHTFKVVKKSSSKIFLFSKLTVKPAIITKLNKLGLTDYQVTTDTPKGMIYKVNLNLLSLSKKQEKASDIIYIKSAYNHYLEQKKFHDTKAVIPNMTLKISDRKHRFKAKSLQLKADHKHKDLMLAGIVGQSDQSKSSKVDSKPDSYKAFAQKYEILINTIEPLLEEYEMDVTDKANLKKVSTLFNDFQKLAKQFNSVGICNIIAYNLDIIAFLAKTVEDSLAEKATAALLKSVKVIRSLNHYIHNGQNASGESNLEKQMLKQLKLVLKTV